MRGRWIIALIVGLLSVTGLVAQGRRGGGERNVMPSKEQIQSEKKAYLTKELQLTDKEADGLMVILNDLDEQRFKLWQSTEQTRNRIRRGDTLSDEEYQQHFDKVMNNRVREAELERTYYAKCKSVLPLSKLVRIERVHREFAKHYFQKKPR